MSENIKLGTHLIFWACMIMLFLLVSCKSAQIASCIPEGQIIKQDGDSVLVIFEEIGGKPHTYWYQWFYMPGEGLVSSETHFLDVRIKPKGPLWKSKR